MTTIPTFDFRIKDAANRDSARRFAEVLVSTGKFTRNAKSQVLFQSLGAYTHVANKGILSAILTDAGAIEVTGDLGEPCDDCLWMYLCQYAWKLRRTGAAFDPPKPLPVRGVPYQAPALNTPEKAFQRVQR